MASFLPSVRPCRAQGRALQGKRVGDRASEKKTDRRGLGFGWESNLALRTNQSRPLFCQYFACCVRRYRSVIAESRVLSGRSLLNVERRVHRTFP